MGGVFVLIGGLWGGGYSSSATYFYEEKKGWRPGPNLKNARGDHTAGVLTDRVSTKQYIVAVGGLGAYTSVEYLEYPGSNEWMEGPDLPIPLEAHGMVEFGTDLVVMGGLSNGSLSSAFYQLSAENGIFK